MASVSAQNYADGSVVEITQGSPEFQAILQSAATRRQLVLLDFTVSWCGPCRMLAPVLEQIAQEYQGKVVVAKMNCEKTPANQSFAASSAITAYPTLKLFRDRTVAATLRGASPASLRQAIAQQLEILGPSAGTQDAPGALASALVAALKKVKATCSFHEFIAATKALLVYAGNVVEHPGESKYRKVRLSNQGFQSKLGSIPGGRECMEVLGFRERTEAMEAVLIMDDVHPQLQSVMSLLNEALAQASSAPEQDPGQLTHSSLSARTPPVAAAFTRQMDSTPLLATSLSTDARVPPPAHASGSGSHCNDAAGPSSGMRVRVQRPKNVNPALLARILEKILQDSGFS